jgi:choloylglycine hydrolase
LYLILEQEGETMRNFKYLLFILVCMACVMPTKVSACTGIQVQATDGSVVFARTMEFGTPLKSNILFVPRAQNWISQAPNNSDGMTWQNQYAFLGVNAFNKKFFIDGVNEKGLYIGCFWFPGNAKYQEESENTANIVTPQMLATLVLGSCATIEDVQKKISEITLVGVEFKELNMVLPLHWVVMDSTGKGLAIEPIGGNVVVKENPVGVFTNSPTFSWHLQNLSNYINLTPSNSQPLKIDEFIINGIGQGTGLLGIPGDLTPPSRFVRAALYRNAAEKVDTTDSAINQAFLLINNISIVKGIARETSSNGKTSYDHTQWTAVYDLKRHRCYFRSYNNQDINMVQLDKLPLDGDQVLSIPLWDTKPDFNDATGKAAPL